ncbi:MAG: hypothetical protein V8S01_07995 [Dorea sp.]
MQASGAQTIGWRKIGNVWYYLDGNNAEYPGLMLSDCSKEIGGNTYTLESVEQWQRDGTIMERLVLL